MGSIFSLCEELEEESEEVLWLLNEDFRNSPIILRYNSVNLSTPDVFILDKIRSRKSNLSTPDIFVLDKNIINNK